MAPGPRTEAVLTGALLGGRHRLLRALGDSGATTLWRAEDTVLSRPVAVRVLVGPFDDLDPDAYVEAATRAGRITHPRVARVLDAFVDEHPEGGPDVPVAAVVTEWRDGLSLAALLRDAPLDPLEALEVTAQVVAALRATHAAGAAHGRLHPGNVLLDSRGHRDGHRRRGRRGAGRRGPVRRPGRGGAGGPAARRRGALRLPDRPLAARPRPGQRRRHRRAGAGALGRGTPGHPPAGARRGAAPARQPHPADARRRPRAATPACTAWRPRTAPSPPAGRSCRPGCGPRRAPGAPLLPRWVRILVPLGVVALVGAGGWQVGMLLGRVPGTSTATPLTVIGEGPSAAALGAGGAGPLVPVAVTAFDPQGDGAEHSDAAPLAVDGDASTSWTTDRYRSAAFGGLKTGVGLVLDLGAARDVAGVTVALRASGVDLELRSAGTAGSPPAALDGWSVVASSTGNRDTAELVPPAPVTTRYLLVWVTHLPAVPGGFQAALAEITVQPAR